MFNLQGKHEGETIFVLGCGPSLTTKVCEKLRGKGAITIGVNEIHRTFLPTYHLHVDYYYRSPGENFSTKARGSLEKLISLGTELIAPLDHSLKPTTDLPHQAFYSCRETSFATCYQESMRVLRLGHSSTSIYHALQLAVIMGAKKIVLIGVDFYVETDSKGVGKMHRYDHETKIGKKEIKSLDDRRMKFDNDLKNRNVLATLKDKDVEVVNASKKSKVKTFKKVKLSEVL